MVVLLLACTVVLMVRRGRKKVALLHKHTALVSSSTKPGVTINMKDLKMNMALSTPIMNNGLTRSRVTATKSKVRRVYDVVSKSFRTGHLERELQIVQLSASRCSCISIL